MVKTLAKFRCRKQVTSLDRLLVDSHLPFVRAASKIFKASIFHNIHV